MDALPAASQQVPAPTAPDVEELNGKNSFQYVIDSLPHHLRRIAHLEAFLEEAAEIPQKFFKTGRFLPRGDILLWLHKEYATQRDTILLPDSLVVKRIRNPAEDAKRSVIVYRVPLWFELENFEDFFGEELACYRRFTKKGTLEETELWNSKSTLSKMRPSTFKRRRSMSQTKLFAPLPRLWPR
jgi:hypothetical protein